MANELLSDQLKIRTLVSHQELEKLLVQRMREIRTVNDYLNLLKYFYRYFGALEDRVDLYITNKELPDYQVRRKSASLSADILSLGGKLPEKMPHEALPIIENRLQAFGTLYVMEGSTLGGLIISQMIRKQLSVSDQHLSFFQSYGDSLFSMWNSFKLALDRQPEAEADREVIIAAAGATFLQFKKLLEA
jgi:heme oxygenase